MVSPYLDRPLRSYEQALRDRAERLAAQGHHGMVSLPVETVTSEPVVLASESHQHDIAALSLNDVMHDDAASALSTATAAATPTMLPVDAAPLVHGPLPELDLVDFNTAIGAFG